MPIKASKCDKPVGLEEVVIFQSDFHFHHQKASSTARKWKEEVNNDGSRAQLFVLCLVQLRSCWSFYFRCTPVATQPMNA